MSEPVKRRRRWPWVALAVATVLFGGLAWRHRPLNATERALVGRWRLVPKLSETYTRTFRKDRTFEDAVPIGGGEMFRTSGTWTASSTSLRFYDIDWSHNALPAMPMPWSERIRIIILGTKYPGVYFDGPDRYRHGDAEFVRVPD